MKFAVFVAFVILGAVLTIDVCRAIPVVGEENFESDTLQKDIELFESSLHGTGGEEESSGRFKRATCDLLSPFKVGHAACAAHCIAKGFKGGWCNGNAVCNCRR